jgi:D-3-phosphoglycerate dehydrogenase
MTKILIPDKLSDEAERKVTEAGGLILRASGRGKADMLGDVADCDALVVSQKPDGYIIDREIMTAGKRLKLIARFGVGMEIIDLAAAKELGIAVTNTAGSNANAAAEHALFLMLSAARNARQVDLRFRAGEFAEIRKTLTVELEGSLLGVVGCGNVGRLVARKARYGFGMDVAGYDPVLDPSMKIPEIRYLDSLEELLKICDFISLHLPAAPGTVNLLDKKRLMLMKPSAILINTSRGEVVSEPDLVEQLCNGGLRAAGLDVYSQEPLDMQSELFSLKNVIMTPHVAAFTAKTMAKTSLYVAESLVDFIEGRPPARRLF